MTTKYLVIYPLGSDAHLRTCGKVLSTHRLAVCAHERLCAEQRECRRINGQSSYYDLRVVATDDGHTRRSLTEEEREAMMYAAEMRERR